MLSRKKALFVCGNLPYPVVSGGRKRELQLLTELSFKYDTDFLCITRDIVNDRKNIKSLGGHVCKVKLLPATSESECRLSEFISTENLFKRFQSDQVCLWLRENILNYDLIHFERSVIMPTFLIGSCTPIIISEQNIESEIVSQVMKSEDLNEADKITFDNYLKLLQRHENLVWNSVFRILTITKNDASHIRSRISDESKVIVLPPKFDHNKTHTIPKVIREGTIKLMYLGNFNYYPNKYAAIYIINKIIPYLEEKGISFEFRIIGNGANNIRNLINETNVTIIDYIENMNEHWEWANLLVAPIFYGSGLKIKIQEALENRTPVITTNSGASGFEHYVNKYVYICEDQLGISNLIQGFLGNTESYSEVTRSLASENLRWDVQEIDYLP